MRDMPPVETNIYKYKSLITCKDRNILNQHKSGVIWLTGLPASGKSTIAHHLEKELYNRGIRAYVLDGDNVRHGLCSNLGFSREDRKENIRRIVEVAKLFADAGLIVLCAFITPYEEDRDFIRKQFKNDNFVEVYVNCSLNTCEKRDLKGLYKKARAGIVKDYTGISSPFEEPKDPDVIIDTERLSVQESVSLLLDFLKKIKFIEL